MTLVRLGELDVHLRGGDGAGESGDGPVVVLLHGFGAPGDDLVSLARGLAPDRRVRFAFPEAPLDLGPLYAGGRAWWWVDIAARQQAIARGERDIYETTVPDGLGRARDAVVRMLDDLRHVLDVGDAPIVLGGFSQGAMLACDVALRTSQNLAGLMLFSGTLITREEWRGLAPSRARLPTLLTHGNVDTVLDLTGAQRLRDLLTIAGLAVEWLPFEGGHEIPREVLDAGRSFLARVLGGSSA